MATLFTHGRPKAPSGFKVAPQSYASLEAIADELRGYLTFQDGQRYKLDCRKLLEHTLQSAGFRFKVAYAESMGEYAAFTVPTAQIIVIRDDVYDLLDRDNVYGRSTVVHETAHIVLGHAVTLHRGVGPGSHKFFEDSEWQAKALTAATMMPLEACRSAWSADELANMCGTSLQSATYRLQRLVKDGLIQRPGGLAKRLPA